jgi:hypothetical protein
MQVVGPIAKYKLISTRLGEYHEDVAFQIDSENISKTARFCRINKKGTAPAKSP